MNLKFYKSTKTKKNFAIERLALPLKICSFLAITWSFIGSVCASEKINYEIRIFCPKGFEFSLPHKEGITFFEVYVFLNHKNPLIRSDRIIQPKNGSWIFRDRETELKLGDKLSYSMTVDENGVRRTTVPQNFVVKHYDADSDTDPVPGDEVGEVSTTPPPQRLNEERSCPTSKTTVNGIAKRCAGQIVFEDDFSGSQLDTNKWKIERRFADEPDNEFVWYLNDIPEVLSVINGTVIIKPIAANVKFSDPLRNSHNLGPTCTGTLETNECVRHGRKNRDVPLFISAQFTTKGSFAFKYGRIEIRAKLPNAPWVFPQIWLQPRDSIYPANDYLLGQMRVAFSRSDGNAIHLFGGAILHKNEPLRSATMCKMASSQNAGWGDEFHVYELVWTEKFIAVAVDNEEYCRISPTSDSDALYNTKINAKMLPNRNKLSESSSLLAPFDQEFFIVLGYGIGGHTDFADGDSWQEVKPWRNDDPKAMKKFWKQKEQSMQQWLANGDFKIDYVKVYAV